MPRKWQAARIHPCYGPWFVPTFKNRLFPKQPQDTITSRYFKNNFRYYFKKCALKNFRTADAKGLEDLMLQAGLVRISHGNRKNHVDKWLGHKLLSFHATVSNGVQAFQNANVFQTSWQIVLLRGVAHNSEKCGKGEQWKPHRGQKWVSKDVAPSRPWICNSTPGTWQKPFNLHAVRARKATKTFLLNQHCHLRTHLVTGSLRHLPLVKSSDEVRRIAPIKEMR